MVVELRTEQFINTGLTNPLLNSNRVLVTTNNQFGNAGDVLKMYDFNGQKNIPVGSDDPNNIDGDGDGIGCDSNDNDDNNNGSDLDCEDVDERNFQVGNNDPNNFDGDGDGIGCESSSNNDDDNLNTISGQ